MYITQQNQQHLLVKQLFSKQQYMTTFKFILSTIILFLIGVNHTYAQGCSDAGFCTIDSFKPHTDSMEVLNNQMKVGVFYGKADNSISAYGNYIEYNHQLNDNFGFDAKLTSIAQNGNGISTFGFSDFFINANYKVSEKFKLTLGTKIPLSNASKTFNDIPLPMDYQASLGTLDLIFGLGYQINKIQLVAAIQQPLTKNDNEFIASAYPADSPLNSFQSTNKFKRSGDVLLRVSYPISITPKLQLTPSILPIYHLANDKFTDEFNTEKEITASNGLTLNGNAYLDYQIDDKNSIQLNIGMPFITRDSRPDGLTRSFIANLEYKIKF